MSKAIKQIVVVAAVVAISMVFIIQFRPGTNVELGGGPTCAIEISGDCIPHSDFSTAFRLAAPNVEPEVLKQLRMREQIVEGLVERWLLLQDAERLGVTASSKEVTEAIAGNALVRFSLPAGQEDTFLFLLQRYMGPQVVPPPYGPAKRIPVFDPKTSKFDYKRYQRWVQRSTNKTEKDFKEFQRQELIAARMKELVRARVRVSEAEARARFAEDNDKVVVDYLKLERGYYRDYAIDTSKDAIDAWAKDNAEEVDQAWEGRKEKYLPECRKARHLLVRLDETLPDKEEAKKKAREAAEAAKARIEGGEAFAEVARAISEDPNTKSKGGELGCFAAGKLAAPSTTKDLDKAISELATGAVSDVIETQYGFHLVTVDAVLDEAAAEKLGKRETAKDLYLRKESERMAAEGAKQILAAVKDGKSLQEALDAHLEAVLPEAAKEAYVKGRESGEEDSSGPLTAWTDPSRPKIRESDPFTAAGPPFSQVQTPAEAAKALFALEKPGELPEDVIKLYDGYAVAALKKREPVTDEVWAEKRGDFLDALRRDKQRDAVIAYVQRLREQHGKEIVYRVKLTEDTKKEEAPPPDPG